MANDPLLIARLAEVLGVPEPPNATWRSATVVMLASDAKDAVAAQVVHVQHLDWAVREQVLIELAIQVLREYPNSRGAPPPDAEHGPSFGDR
jgi:hypothetical protein